MPKQLRLVEWDRDYHTVSNTKIIDSPSQVEDDCAGLDYWYTKLDERGPHLDAQEARKYLAGDLSLNKE